MPVAVDEELSRQFQDLGAAIAPGPCAPEIEAFDVFPANWTSLRTWLRCETQWRFVASASGRLLRIGLDYAGIDVLLRRLGLDDPDGVFADLTVMEDAALEALREAQA